MPLHKSSRAHRLDPTMISAPLGDFRHTMHIGRGGDAFGDTSFLSSHGPSSPSPTPTPTSNPPVIPATVETTEIQMNHESESRYTDEPLPSKLQHSDSVSSFDLDLDLGPSILGDVLGVMDGLTLGSDWTRGKESEEVFGSSKSTMDAMMLPKSSANAFNERKRMENMTKEESQSDDQLTEVNGMKSKGLRPKVRFSDKRDEIIGRQDVIEGLEVEGEEEMFLRPSKGIQEISGRTSYEKNPGQTVELSNRRADTDPSPSSSMSSEYEGVSPLDRRREEQHLSETDSEEEEANGEQGYTFEDEFDDEIGL